MVAEGGEVASREDFREADRGGFRHLCPILAFSLGISCNAAGHFPA